MIYSMSDESKKDDSTQKQYKRMISDLASRKLYWGYDIKSYTEQLKDLELAFANDINEAVLNLISVKFSNTISQIAKVQIKDIIDDAINGTIYINEIKDNLATYIRSYIANIEDEKHELSLRMDFLEQRLLDFMKKIETEYSKKACYDESKRA